MKSVCAVGQPPGGCWTLRERTRPGNAVSQVAGPAAGGEAPRANGEDWTLELGAG